MVILIHPDEKRENPSDEATEQPPPYTITNEGESSSGPSTERIETAVAKSLPPLPPTLHVINDDEPEQTAVPDGILDPHSAASSPSSSQFTRSDSPTQFESQSHLNVQNPYLHSSASSSTLRSTYSGARTPPSHLQRTNFVSATRANTMLRGTYVIDPTLHVPESLLPPLQSWETGRRNLLLQTTNGGMNVDVWLVGGQGGSGDEFDQRALLRPKRADVSVIGANGSTKVRVHSEEGVPAHLNVAVYNGAGHLWLPRSFNGPIRSSTGLGWVVFSSAFQPSVHSFGSDGYVKRYFVGPMDSMHEGQKWEGWEMDLNVRNARLKIAWVDELGEAEDASGMAVGEEAEVKGKGAVKGKGKEKGRPKEQEQETENEKPKEETKKERKEREEREKAEVKRRADMQKVEERAREEARKSEAKLRVDAQEAELQAKIEQERLALREKLLREEMEKREREELARQFERERKALEKGNSFMGKLFKSSSSSAASPSRSGSN